MTCSECLGACCESFFLSDKDIAGIEGHEAAWVALHATEGDNSRFEFECACTKLKDGKCSEYDTRPGVCRAFEEGGNECLDTIVRRR